MAVLLLAAAGTVVVVAVVPGDQRAAGRAPGPVARRAAVTPPAGAASGATRPPGVVTIGGKALQSARCRQWRTATASERDAVVATLAYVVGGPTPYGPASTIPVADAHRLFDRACARGYARGFLLYELYTRAAGFHGATGRSL